MKIAIFYNLHFGGAKRVVFEHVKGVKKRNHEVHVFTTDDYTDSLNPSLVAHKVFRYKFREGENKIPVIDRLINDFRIFYTLPKLHGEIAQDIDKKKYDVVIVHPDRFTQAPYLLRFLKTPSVYICQEPLRIAYEYSLRLKENVFFLKRLYEEGTRLIRKRIDRINARAATYPLASCCHIRERMIEAYDIYPKVLYAGVDQETFRPLNIKRENQVFFVGSKFHPIDGYDLAEQALKLIPSKVRPRLKIVSWEKDNRERLTDEEFVKIYNESIATLCLARLETFGLVPLESMACGTPVIATNISGHRETIINNKTGFLVDFDPREIAEKIIFLINNPEKVKKMAFEARKHIESYWTWEKRIKDLESVLLKIVKKWKSQ